MDSRKKTLLYICVFFAFAFFCAETANADIWMDKGDFRETVYDMCTGDNINIEGTYNVQLTSDDSSGSSENFKISCIANGVGVSSVAVNEYDYVFKKNVDMNLNISEKMDPFIADFDMSCPLLGTGYVPNAYLRCKLHVAFWNGQFRSFPHSFLITCSE